MICMTIIQGKIVQTQIKETILSNSFENQECYIT